MSQPSLPCASRNITETQDVDISLMARPKKLVNYYISLCAHHRELMKSAGSCSSSLLFTMKVTVCLFKSNSLKQEMFADIGRVSGALKTEKDEGHHKSYYVHEKSGTPCLASHFLVTTEAIWRVSESRL